MKNLLTKIRSLPPDQDCENNLKKAGSDKSYWSKAGLTRDRFSDRYGTLIRRIIKAYEGKSWDDCLVNIKEKIPASLYYQLYWYEPYTVNRDGNFVTTHKQTLTYGPDSTDWRVYDYIDKQGIVRFTKPKMKMHKTYQPPRKKVKKIDYWDPKYKLDFEITSVSGYINYTLLENRPQFAFFNGLSVERFVQWCEKNRKTYRIVERGGRMFHFGERGRTENNPIRYTYYGPGTVTHYKPFYND